MDLQTHTREAAASIFVLLILLILVEVNTEECLAVETHDTSKSFLSSLVAPVPTTASLPGDHDHSSDASIARMEPSVCEYRTTTSDKKAFINRRGKDEAPGYSFKKLYPNTPGSDSRRRIFNNLKNSGRECGKPCISQVLDTLGTPKLVQRSSRSLVEASDVLQSFSHKCANIQIPLPRIHNFENGNIDNSNNYESLHREEKLIPIINIKTFHNYLSHISDDLSNSLGPASDEERYKLYFQNEEDHYTIIPKENVTKVYSHYSDYLHSPRLDSRYSPRYTKQHGPDINDFVSLPKPRLRKRFVPLPKGDPNQHMLPSDQQLRETRFLKGNIIKYPSDDITRCVSKNEPNSHNCFCITICPGCCQECHQLHKPFLNGYTRNEVPKYRFISKAAADITHHLSGIKTTKVTDSNRKFNHEVKDKKIRYGQRQPPRNQKLKYSGRDYSTNSLTCNDKCQSQFKKILHDNKCKLDAGEVTGPNSEEAWKINYFDSHIDDKTLENSNKFYGKFKNISRMHGSRYNVQRNEGSWENGKISKDTSENNYDIMTIYDFDHQDDDTPLTYHKHSNNAFNIVRVEENDSQKYISLSNFKEGEVSGTYTTYSNEQLNECGQLGKNVNDYNNKEIISTTSNEQSSYGIMTGTNNQTSHEIYKLYGGTKGFVTDKPQIYYSSKELHLHHSNEESETHLYKCKEALILQDNKSSTLHAEGKGCKPHTFRAGEEVYESSVNTHLDDEFIKENALGGNLKDCAQKEETMLCSNVNDINILKDSSKNIEVHTHDKSIEYSKSVEHENANGTLVMKEKIEQPNRNNKSEVVMIYKGYESNTLCEEHVHNMGIKGKVHESDEFNYGNDTLDNKESVREYNIYVPTLPEEHTHQGSADSVQLQETNVAYNSRSNSDGNTTNLFERGHSRKHMSEKVTASETHNKHHSKEYHDFTEIKPALVVTEQSLCVNNDEEAANDDMQSEFVGHELNENAKHKGDMTSVHRRLYKYGVFPGDSSVSLSTGVINSQSEEINKHSYEIFNSNESRHKTSKFESTNYGNSNHKSTLYASSKEDSKKRLYNLHEKFTQNDSIHLNNSHLLKITGDINGFETSDNSNISLANSKEQVTVSDEMIRAQQEHEKISLFVSDEDNLNNEKVSPGDISLSAMSENTQVSVHGNEFLLASSLEKYMPLTGEDHVEYFPHETYDVQEPFTYRTEQKIENKTQLSRTETEYYKHAERKNVITEDSTDSELFTFGPQNGDQRTELVSSYSESDVNKQYTTRTFNNMRFSNSYNGLASLPSFRIVDKDGITGPFMSNVDNRKENVFKQLHRGVSSESANNHKHSKEEAPPSMVGRYEIKLPCPCQYQHRFTPSQLSRNVNYEVQSHAKTVTSKDHSSYTKTHGQNIWTNPYHVTPAFIPIPKHLVLQPSYRPLQAQASVQHGTRPHIIYQQVNYPMYGNTGRLHGSNNIFSQPSKFPPHKSRTANSLQGFPFFLTSEPLQTKHNSFSKIGKSSQQYGNAIRSRAPKSISRTNNYFEDEVNDVDSYLQKLATNNMNKFGVLLASNTIDGQRVQELSSEYTVNNFPSTMVSDEDFDHSKEVPVSDVTPENVFGIGYVPAKHGELVTAREEDGRRDTGGSSGHGHAELNTPPVSSHRIGRPHSTGCWACSSRGRAWPRDSKELQFESMIYPSG